MEDNTRSSESKERRRKTRSSESKEKRRKSMEDNTRSSESKEKKRKSMEDNTPTESESEEDILDEGDEEADEEHDQDLETALSILRRLADSIIHGGASAVVSPASYGVPRSRAPSFFRKARPRKPREMIHHHVGATGTSQSVPGQNIVLVRPRTSAQTNPQERDGTVPMEGDEEIFEEEAVCKKCFHNLKEENILKTECKCGNALIHEECADEWSRTRGNNNCDFCGQEVQTFPVTLVRGLNSSTQVVDREESNKCFGWFG